MTQHPSDDGRMNTTTVDAIALPEATRQEIAGRNLFLAGARIDDGAVLLTVAKAQGDETLRIRVNEFRVFETPLGEVEAQLTRLTARDGPPVAVLRFNRAISAWYVLDAPGAFVYNEFEFGMSPVLVDGAVGDSFAALCRRVDHGNHVRTLGGVPAAPGAL